MASDAASDDDDDDDDEKKVMRCEKILHEEYGSGHYL